MDHPMRKRAPQRHSEPGAPPVTSPPTKRAQPQGPVLRRGSLPGRWNPPNQPGNPPNQPELTSTTRNKTLGGLKSRRKSVDFDLDAYESLSTITEDPLTSNFVNSLTGGMASESNDENAIQDSPRDRLAPRVVQIERFKRLSSQDAGVPLFYLTDLPASSDAGDKKDLESIDYLRLGLPRLHDANVSEDEEEEQLRKPFGDFIADEAAHQAITRLEQWDPAISSNESASAPRSLRPKTLINIPLCIAGRLPLEGYWGIIEYFAIHVELWLQKCALSDAFQPVAFPSRVRGGCMEYLARNWRPEELGHRRRLGLTETNLSQFNSACPHPLPPSKMDRHRASQLWRSLLFICPDLYRFTKTLTDAEPHARIPSQVHFIVDPLNPVTGQAYTMRAIAKDQWALRRRILVRRLLFLQFLHQRDYFYCALPKNDTCCTRLTSTFPVDPAFYRWNPRFLALLRTSLWSIPFWNQQINGPEDPSSEASRPYRLNHGKSLFDRYPIELRGGTLIARHSLDVPRMWPSDPEDCLLMHVMVTPTLLTSSAIDSINLNVPNEARNDLQGVALFRKDPIGYLRKHFDQQRKSCKNALIDAMSPLKENIAPTPSPSRSDLANDLPSPRQLASIPSVTRTPLRSRGRETTSSQSRSMTPTRMKLLQRARARKDQNAAEKEILKPWSDLIASVRACGLAIKVLPHLNAFWRIQGAGNESFNLPTLEVGRLVRQSDPQLMQTEDPRDLDLMTRQAVDLLIDAGVETNLLAVVHGHGESCLRSAAHAGHQSRFRSINATKRLLDRRQAHFQKAVRDCEEDIVQMYPITQDPKAA